MHCDLYWFCDTLVWHFSEKRWQHGFDLTKELTVCHTVPCPALINIKNMITESGTNRIHTEGAKVSDADEKTEK